MRKRRRSRKRFERIPSLPRNISIPDNRESQLSHAEHQTASIVTAGHTLDRYSVTNGIQNRSTREHTGSELDRSLKDGGTEHVADLYTPALPFELELDAFEDEEQTSERNVDEDYMTSIGEEADIPEVEQHQYHTGVSNIGATAHLKDILKPKITDWRMLWGVSMTSGSNKMTREQYQSMRAYLETSPKVISASPSLLSTRFLTQHMQLPDYSTMQKKVKPAIMNYLGPRCNAQIVKVDTTKAGTGKMTGERAGDPQTAVRIVLPSEYARADISTPEVFSAMIDTSLLHENDRPMQSSVPSPLNLQCIDSLPLISAREWFYGPPMSVQVDSSECDGPYSNIAERGDTVRISTFASGALNERLIRCFSDGVSDLNQINLSGEIQYIWTVHHRKRRMEPEFCTEVPFHLSERDQNIAKVLQFVSYETPADSVSIVVPELPRECETQDCSGDGSISTKKKPRKSPEFTKALKERRKALLERRIAEEEAWKNWTKPLVKPGDTIALLSPISPEMHHTIDAGRTGLLTNTDKQSRLCLVFRFWTEQEERSRHLLWIPGGAQIPQREEDASMESVDRICSYALEDGCHYLDVRSVALTKAHEGKRGPQKYRPTSSIGELSTGEAYCVYRFLLYWDGFEVQTGKSATGEGIYLLCLNLPTQARASPSAVRIISLTPPGVKSASILDYVIDDSVEGMSAGFVDYDACGTRRRIFLDLVGIIGDTPALNASLDVLGHTGSFYCHLCNISRRSTTEIGSRFTALACNGCATAFHRSFYKHTAVRDCGAQEQTCRALGMRTVAEEEKLVLHRMRAKMLAVKPLIPKDSQGNNVVPCALDPYRACFVAPDHVLTGHARDCINLAFKLLPSPEYRATCEKFMISMLESCALPKQSRLLDHDKKKLYNMSIIEIYALILVAELALKQGVSCAKANNSGVVPSEKCMSAIELVGSASKLISELWYLPRTGRNCASDVQEFQRNYGQTYIARIQCLTKRHISILENICRFRDCEFDELEDLRTPVSRKSILVKIRNACVTAVKTVDKPNVHRILELVSTTLPMLGHVSLFGELVLEKTHQCLKRAIKTSNQKDAHLQAMNNAVLNDWQGRLFESAPLVYENDDKALRACFRLLVGREGVMAVKGHLLDDHKEMVLQGLGPEHCAVVALRRLATPVLSRRYQARTEENWKLKAFVEEVCTAHPLTSSHHKDTLSYFKNAYPLTWTTYKLSIGDSISSTIGTGLKGRSFCRGDVIQLLVEHRGNPACHFPFLSQASAYSINAGLGTEESLWCLHSVISKVDAHQNAEILLALIPCVKQDIEGYTEDLYSIDTNAPISFATLNTSIRFVPSIHDCIGAKCLYILQENSIRHETTSRPLNGALFIPMTNKKGYPPRMG